MRWFEKQKIITVGLVLLIHLIGGSGFTGVWASVIPPSTSNGEGDAKIALNSNQTESSKLSASAGTSTTNAVKIQVLRIPDRTPVNFTNAQVKEEPTEDDAGSTPTTNGPGKGDFDDKAVQRTVVVIAGITVIIMVYLGVKFVILKKRKVIKRYGRVEASEMDLLDEIEDDESEEEEELFDINRQRRS